MQQSAAVNNKSAYTGANGFTSKHLGLSGFTFRSPLVTFRVRIKPLLYIRQKSPTAVIKREQLSLNVMFINLKAILISFCEMHCFRKRKFFHSPSDLYQFSPET